MDLRQKVLDYHLENFDKLSVADQFHFAIRMTAWLDLDEARQRLRELRAHIAPTPETHEALVVAFRDKLASKPHDKINAFATRAPYFEKYPLLYGAELALFYCHWLQNVYQIDARQALLDAVDLSTLQQLEQALLKDPQAVQALSTYAANYIYMLHIDVLQDSTIPREFFYELGKSYDTANIEQAQLFIYLYTHCILCEAHFYTRTVPAKYLEIYRKMLSALETVIEAGFDKIHLDSKVEFLVCAQICGYQTRLKERIDAECEQSVSEDGTFIVDTLNANPQAHRRSFTTSEHRNVLYIMSGTPYQPHSIAV